MTDPTDDENENTARRKKGAAGEGEQAGSGIAKLLTKGKSEQVQGDHRHLTGNDLIDALVEFCADGIMRATAQAKLVWNKTFTVVTDFLVFCKKELPALAKNLQRGASRDARAPVKQKPPGNNLGMGLKPSGPSE